MGGGQAGIGRRVIWVQEDGVTPVLGKDGTLTSCLVWSCRASLAGGWQRDPGSKFEKCRPCQADPCLRTKVKLEK